MTLIKSISGIRGTIGGKVGENLTPLDIVKFTSAYAVWLKMQTPDKKLNVVVGRDARISGKMMESFVIQTLNAIGIDVINLELATTPTVEIIVEERKADGGIILTASHNPRQWNALKLLNNKGEFLSAADGEQLLEIADRGMFEYADIDSLGVCESFKRAIFNHIYKIRNLPYIDVKAIKEADFKIVIDAVNSVGGIAITTLLKEFGIKYSNITKLYCEPTGEFPHNPEPLPEHLTEISETVVREKADVGFVVDPDVDRLAIVCEDGTMFGEEYTLVAIADYVLSQKVGNTVSNLSSTLALRDITEGYGAKYTASAVGEVNVVEMMKATNAVIGGEGNGGVILPELHYGRDALVGIALFLTYLAKQKISCSELRKTYPNYVISKNKILLTPKVDVDELLNKLQLQFPDKEIISIDGVKIYFDKEWVHLRKSNTEPIIRIYAESSTKESANKLAQDFIRRINELI